MRLTVVDNGDAMAQETIVVTVSPPPPEIVPYLVLGIASLVGLIGALLFLKWRLL